MAKWWKPIALVLVTFVLAVSLKNDFLLFLLGFELLLELAAYCQVLWLARRVRVQVSLPRTRALRGESFQLRAELINESRLPIPRLMVRLAVRAYPEKEELLLNGKLMLDGRERGRLCFQMDSTHCGCLEIRPEQLTVTDFLGVFARRCRIDGGEKHLLFILPETLQENQNPPDLQGIFPAEDGEDRRHGNDTPDPSQIRSYQEGDSLKLVHWKLTARLNKLMVREMSDSAGKLTWLFLNLQEKPGMPPVRRDPDAWDHFVETVASVSAALLQTEKRHMVLWIDSLGSSLVRYSVSDEEGLQEMLCGLLRTESLPPKDFPPLLKEIYSDETKGTCIEIDLQGHFVRAEMP
ncbi:MAG: DUF58 domain-containing protein [Faecousia sp.]